ncbi:hypothetical protein G6L37_03165 [Agrobacterium rubi]|nr:hypothetical protein [Agrobacterium rubi]NTF24375.1 hypothetical protein [Agrobacterium rubi]
MAAKDDITLLLRQPLVDDERIMTHWDSWRLYIAEGGRGSWPRDGFEMLLSSLDGEREDAADEIDRLRARIADLEAGVSR